MEKAYEEGGDKNSCGGESRQGKGGDAKWCRECVQVVLHRKEKNERRRAMFCKMCGEPIEENSDFCSVCGASQKEVERQTKKTPKIDGKAIGTVVGGALVAIATPVGQEVQKAVSKKVQKGVDNVLKKVGLKRKTPLDVAQDVIKDLRKKAGK